MYAPGTLLKLKDQQPNDPETDEAFPYNVVEVINQSPVTHVADTRYQGTDAHGVIILPKTNFGAPLDEPFGKLRTLYEVVSEPEPPSLDPGIRVRPAVAPNAPTPEDVFREEAPGVPSPDGVRGRTPLESPLVDPTPTDPSPLSNLPARAAAEAATVASKATVTKPIDPATGKEKK